VVVLTAAACLVAGCTGGQEPTPSPPSATAVEPAPAPSPTPTTDAPVKPERPAAMDTDDAAGAAAAAEYYVELYAYVMTSGDTSEWDAMSHAECESCAGLLEQARTIAERGDTFVGGATSAEVDDPGKYVRDQQTGIYPLDIAISEEASIIQDAAGAELYSSVGETSRKRIEMGRLNGSWIVVGIAEIP